MAQALLLDTLVSSPAGNSWPVALPVVLGLVAVYLLLPRPRSYPAWWGASVAALALVAAGFLLIQVSGPWAEAVLFYSFSAIAIVSGGLLVTQRNPVRAALAFALVVLSSCGLFLLQAAPFLMAATIIIYAGAIIVTFLFVIMLAQQAGLSDADARSREPLLSCIAGFAMLAAILFVLRTSYSTKEFDELLRSTKLAGNQASADEIQNALGDRREFFERFHRQGEAAPSDTSGEIHAALNALESEWKDGGSDAQKMKHALARLYDAGVQVRNYQGSVQPPAALPLSAYSRPAVAANPDHAGESLPNENVAYLGRSLFSDYLLAVELGGTLLLVATIGAIAIAARRAEGLR
jgi:NADH:ubiquinone oxidoreductase subunit 6 (subunit J)